MNTRQAIQPSNEPAVLSVSFSASRNRFTAALATGLRCFRTDNCLTTYSPQLPSDGSLAVAEALDDRYFAFVGGGRAPAEKDSVAVWWDAVFGCETQRFNFNEAVLGVRVGKKWMVVVLKERAVVFGYQGLRPTALATPPPEDSGDDDKAHQEPLRAPNVVKSLYPTAPNIHALAALHNDLLVLPSQTTGQLQLISLLPQGGKRVLRAHQSSIRCLAISEDGSLLATASEQGTLLRVFDLRALDQVAEYRRGSDHAIIFSLAFSPGNRWLASTSDKGTLHIFDLRPPNAEDIAAAQEKRAKEERQHRKSSSYAGHRLSGQGFGVPGDKDSLSAFSGRSSPASHPSAAGPGTAAYQGSLQEYYSLRPVPSSASPPTTGPGISLMAGLKASPFAPRILKDIRSIASAPFYLGNDPPHWQGEPTYSWTTAPNGTRKRVRNAVPGLPGEPSGRPPKGLLAFAPRKKDDGGSDDEGARLYVIGGGSDARWEMFELLLAEGGGWVVVNRGFRRYLTRQFVD